MKLLLSVVLLALLGPKSHSTIRILAPASGLAIVSNGHPVTASVRVTWDDPAGRESCPSFTLDWANGIREGWDPGCDPYSPDGDAIHIVWLPSSVQYWLPGEYKLDATVTSLGEKHRTSARLSIVSGQ